MNADGSREFGLNHPISECKQTLVSFVYVVGVDVLEQPVKFGRNLEAFVKTRESSDPAIPSLPVDAAPVKKNG